MKKKYRNFEDAKIFVIGLGLRNVDEWRYFTKSKNKPDDIPANPDTVYKNKGWKGYGDWLGNGRTRHFRNFEDARKFVHSLKLKNSDDWIEYYKSKNKPKDIPSAPRQVYKKKWDGMGDWLGTGFIATHERKYRNFEDARKFVHSLKLKNGTEWTQYIKSKNKPDDIPSSPSSVYKKEWKNLGDWLGTFFISNVERKFWSFEKARNFVHSLNLKSDPEWRKFAKSKERPPYIPANPRRTYKSDFKNMPDWLGTQRIPEKEREYRNFDEARNFVHGLRLRNVAQWRYFTKSKNKPDDIPANPDTVYKNKGWKGYGDWLGTGFIATQDRKFLPYEEAKKIIQQWKFEKTQQGWNEYVRTNRIPSNIPLSPVAVYEGDGWKSWGNWLGTESLSPSEKSKQYLSWDDAKLLYQKYAKEYHIKTKQDWVSFIKTHKLPRNLPPYPDHVYTKKRALRNSKWRYKNV